MSNSRLIFSDLVMSKPEAYFFLELKEILPDYDIWVEPMIFLYKEYNLTKRPTMDGRIPDILITKNQKIEAIIELK